MSVVYSEENYTPQLGWILIKLGWNKIKTKCAGISLIYEAKIISWWTFFEEDSN